MNYDVPEAPNTVPTLFIISLIVGFFIFLYWLWKPRVKAFESEYVKETSLLKQDPRYFVVVRISDHPNDLYRSIECEPKVEYLMGDWCMINSKYLAEELAKRIVKNGHHSEEGGGTIYYPPHRIMYANVLPEVEFQRRFKNP